MSKQARSPRRVGSLPGPFTLTPNSFLSKMCLKTLESSGQKEVSRGKKTAAWKQVWSRRWRGCWEPFTTWFMISMKFPNCGTQQGSMWQTSLNSEVDRDGLVDWHIFIHWLTYYFTHSFTPLLAYSLPPSLAHSLLPLLTHFLTSSLTSSLTHLLPPLLTHSLTHSLAVPLTGLLICSLTPLLTPSPAHSLTRDSAIST